LAIELTETVEKESKDIKDTLSKALICVDSERNKRELLRLHFESQDYQKMTGEEQGLLLRKLLERTSTDIQRRTGE
jgi:hypothetical protein